MGRISLQISLLSAVNLIVSVDVLIDNVHTAFWVSSGLSGAVNAYLLICKCLFT